MSGVWASRPGRPAHGPSCPFAAAAFAAAFLFLAGTASAKTFVSWTPSLVDHTSINFRDAFPFERARVDRVAGQQAPFTLDVLAPTGANRPGRLLLEGNRVRFQQPTTRKMNPGIIVRLDSLALIDMNPSFVSITALKKANPNPLLYCMRLEVRAEDNFPGDTHTMLICTDKSDIVKYFKKAGEDLKFKTAQNGLGDHNMAMARLGSTLFNQNHGMKACDAIRHPNLFKTAKKWKKPKNKIYERTRGTKVKVTTAKGAIFVREPHLFRVGDKMRVAGFLTGNSEQAATGLILSIRGSESVAEYRADLDLMQDSFKERFRVYHQGKYELSAPLKAFLKFGRAAIATSNDYVKFIRQVLQDFAVPVIQGNPNLQVFICGHSLGGFMAQAAAMHLMDTYNAKVTVVTTSAPGASHIYRTMGQQLFGAPAVNPFPANPGNIINLVNFYDWIPRIGRQPGVTCVSTSGNIAVQGAGLANVACSANSNLQFTGAGDAFGKCMAAVHNQFHPGLPNNQGSFQAHVTCCARGALNCGVYIPLPAMVDAMFEDFGDESEDDGPGPGQNGNTGGNGGNNQANQQAQQGGDDESGGDDDSSEGEDDSEFAIGGGADAGNGVFDSNAVENGNVGQGDGGEGGEEGGEGGQGGVGDAGDETR
ncbi:hypothetical protein DFJ74DRAFT_669381 [Hyaloraphidium curvatum]|nr:hypothetical protein DFJ74DRAFT_669381 [Hyaloraphidium curvatum]